MHCVYVALFQSFLCKAKDRNAAGSTCARLGQPGQHTWELLALRMSWRSSKASPTRVQTASSNTKSKRQLCSSLRSAEGPGSTWVNEARVLLQGGCWGGKECDSLQESAG